MYGEYAFVVEQRIGCHVNRLCLRREHDYDVPVEELAKRIA
jgi:hypothetical protein